MMQLKQCPTKGVTALPVPPRPAPLTRRGRRTPLTAQPICPAAFVACPVRDAQPTRQLVRMAATGSPEQGPAKVEVPLPELEQLCIKAMKTLGYTEEEAGRLLDVSAACAAHNMQACVSCSWCAPFCTPHWRPTHAASHSAQHTQPVRPHRPTLPSTSRS